MLDQAEALRKLADNDGKENQKNNISKIITVTSGKGGVGKSNFVVNLAITLQKMVKKFLFLTRILAWEMMMFLWDYILSIIYLTLYLLI